MRKFQQFDSQFSHLKITHIVDVRTSTIFRVKSMRGIETEFIMRIASYQQSHQSCALCCYWRSSLSLLVCLFGYVFDILHLSSVKLRCLIKFSWINDDRIGSEVSTIFQCIALLWNETGWCSSFEVNTANCSFFSESSPKLRLGEFIKTVRFRYLANITDNAIKVWLNIANK